MKAVLCPQPSPLSEARALPLTRSRGVDYLELTKPRIAVLVLFTVAIGAMLAARGMPNPVVLFHTLVGTALVAGGASALNQLLERDTDALMQRTSNRPLPAGRLTALEVLIFGALLGVSGVLYLAVFLSHPTAAAVAAGTFVCYVFIYTPLKRTTTLNTLVGAVPGALPPVIGWTALRGGWDREATALFLILFLWQVPHFLAIAWIYREDYARAGLRMLPTVDRTGGLTARQMVGYCVALIPASLLPVALGMAGVFYAVAALGLDLCFLGAALGFLQQRSEGQARSVMRASLIYLPVLLALLLADDGHGTRNEGRTNEMGRAVAAESNPVARQTESIIAN